MAHVDWEASTDIEEMLGAIDNGQFERQLRQFLVACAKRVLHFLDQREFAIALECSNRFADDQAAESDLAASVNLACALMEPHIDIPTVRDFAGSAVLDASSVYPCTKSKAMAVLSCAAQAIAQADAESAADAEYDIVFDQSLKRETEAQRDLLRRFVQNPDRGCQ